MRCEDRLFRDGEHDQISRISMSSSRLFFVVSSRSDSASFVKKSAEKCRGDEFEAGRAVKCSLY